MLLKMKHWSSSQRVSDIIIIVCIWMVSATSIDAFSPFLGRLSSVSKYSIFGDNRQMYRHTIQNRSHRIQHGDNYEESEAKMKMPTVLIHRRQTVIQATTTLILGLNTLFNPSFSNANAASEVKPKEFIDVGTQAPAPEGESPFIELSNGVKIKEFRRGSGEEVIVSTSSVQIQCSGKLLNLNGVSFYNTKNNNPDGFGAIPLNIQLGTGQALPGLESGIVGMRKGGIRRIIVPAELAYSKYPDLEPQPTTLNDQRALDSVVKNPRRDATILFDVSVERFK